jgi:hypothetical protein
MEISSFSKDIKSALKGGRERERANHYSMPLFSLDTNNIIVLILR